MKLARQEVLEERAKYWENSSYPPSLNRAATKEKVVGFQDCWDIVEPIIVLANRIVSDEFSLVYDGYCLICDVEGGYDSHADDCALVVLRIYLRSLKYATEE